MKNPCVFDGFWLNHEDSNQRQNKVKIAAKHGRNHGFDPAVCKDTTNLII